MNFTQSFRLAIKSLLTSKMRALLTMLGIIIGVGAVIVITSLGNGMQQMMNQQFEQLGANLLQVQIYNYGGASSRMVDPADMYAPASAPMCAPRPWCGRARRSLGAPPFTVSASFSMTPTGTRP